MPLIPHYRVEIRVLRLNHKKDNGKTVDEVATSLSGYIHRHEVINLYEFLKAEAHEYQARENKNKPRPRRHTP